MLEKNSENNYYDMGEDQDIFGFLSSLPLPGVRDEIMVAAIGIWATGFRYARRCLWKEALMEKAMANDARKAADCFDRLAILLEKESQLEP